MNPVKVRGPTGLYAREAELDQPSRVACSDLLADLSNILIWSQLSAFFRLRNACDPHLADAGSKMSSLTRNASEPYRKISATTSRSDLSRQITIVENTKVSVPAIVENDYPFKQLASVCRQPICKRRAIQSKVMTVSLLKRAAIFTL